MANIVFNYDGNLITIQEGSGIPDRVKANKLYDLLYALDSSVSLSMFLFQSQGDAYLYRFTTKDGRTWEQTITLPEELTEEPLMTFSVDDEFKLTGFRPSRELRNLAIEMVRLGEAEKITANF